MKYGKGWYYESWRHSLAAKGIKSSMVKKDIEVRTASLDDYPVGSKEREKMARRLLKIEEKQKEKGSLAPEFRPSGVKSFQYDGKTHLTKMALKQHILTQSAELMRQKELSQSDRDRLRKLLTDKYRLAKLEEAKDWREKANWEDVNLTEGEKKEVEEAIEQSAGTSEKMKEMWKEDVDNLRKDLDDLDFDDAAFDVKWDKLNAGAQKLVGSGSQIPEVSEKLKEDVRDLLEKRRAMLKAQRGIYKE